MVCECVPHSTHLVGATRYGLNGAVLAAVPAFQIVKRGGVPCKASLRLSERVPVILCPYHYETVPPLVTVRG